MPVKAKKRDSKLRGVKYDLPVFDLDTLLAHIEQRVKTAPNGVVPLIIDLFCGAGGSSDGLQKAVNESGFECYVTIAGINHDRKAIYSHAVNHPQAYYSTEDFKTASLTRIMEIKEACEKKFPQCPVIIWASFDCTNHSNAKGGMSRDADSRTLAWHIFRYLDIIKPIGLWVENVKEFSEWGPLMYKTVMIKSGKKFTQPEVIPEDNLQQYYTDLMNAGYISYSCLQWTKDESNKKKKTGVAGVTIPIKNEKGVYYKEWLANVNEHGGFHHQKWFLNCADYGVPQNRKRLFIIFMVKGIDIVKPKQTHAKVPFGNLKPHVPVKTCINFDNEGESIFTPGKIKSEESYKRIYKGLIKFVAGGKKEFMSQRNSGMAGAKVFTVDQPARTVTSTGGNQEIVKAHFLTKYMSGNQKTGVSSGNSIDEPCATITVQQRLYPTTVKFLTRANGTTNNKHNPGSSIEEPAPVLTTTPTLGLANISFLDVIYGNGTPSSIDNVSPTVRTKDGLQHVTTEFITNYQGQSSANSIEDVSPTIMTQEKLALTGIKYFICNSYTGGGQVDDINNPSSALTTNPKQRFVSAKPWISPTNFDNPGTSIDAPAPTILASRKHHNIIYTRQWGGNMSSVNVPSPTVIARQDKEPVSMLTLEGLELEEGEIFMAIPVFEDDCPTVVLIKEFMALYGISDIMIRMLEVPELLKIQSFPGDYYLASGSTDQKKFIGNAVPPLIAQRIAEAMYPSIVKYMIQSLKLAA